VSGDNPFATAEEEAALAAASDGGGKVFGKETRKVERRPCELKASSGKRSREVGKPQSWRTEKYRLSGNVRIRLAERD